MNYTFPIKLAKDLDQIPAEKKWLIEKLWIDQGVGIIGGEPKCCKSFLSLDIAVSIASGTACLGQFNVSKIAPVLLFAAEDALHIVRSRLQAIALNRGIELDKLNIYVITAAMVRLDQEHDIEKLTNTIEQIRPAVLILDPFVRLHRIDENNSSEVAAILAKLRKLQRTYGLSIIVVHHAKKGAANERAGQALRGSSEFHAWGDSNLYLRRNKLDQITLTVEHRSEAAISGVSLYLKSEDNKIALCILDKKNIEYTEESVDLSSRIMKTLANSPNPLTQADIRQTCKARTSSICDAINNLLINGKITKVKDGYSTI